MTAKDLKNALLQEAVQGKLVPQKTCEGNARDLLEEIRKERLSHGLDFANAKSKKKGKKETALAGSNPCDIPEDEIPFDIPESWCWCRLGEVINLLSGQDFEPQFYNNKGNGIPYITGASNIEGEHVIINRWTETPKNIALKNDLLLVCKGSGYGTTVIADFDKAHIARQIMSIRSNVNLNYIRLFISTKFKYIKSQGKGLIPGIDRKTVLEMLFPLPPLAEQKRIVAAIEKFMPLIEEYGKKETVLNELNAQIGTLTKKAILQEAVQGKLVPQIPSEGNAKDLLEQIKAQKAALIKDGKIKKEKPLPEITEDEIPFDIPENWCWCRLGELGLYRKGPFGSSLTKSMFVPKSDVSIKVYEQKNAIQKDFSLGDYYISKEKFESMQSFIVEPTDIIVSCAGTIGEVYKLPNEAPIGIINQALMRVKLVNEELASFWMMYFDYVLKKEASKQGSGTAIKNIPPFEILKAYPFPLPPLAEQKRIVEAIEKMLPMCEKLGK